MAVIDAVPGLQVNVEVGRETATEYDCPATDNHEEATNNGYTRTIVKYIEAKAWAEYRVKIIRDESFRHIADNVYFRLEIDGFAGGPGKSDEGWSKYSAWEQNIHSFYAQNDMDGEVAQYIFYFQHLAIEEGEDFNHADIECQKEIIKNLGTIKVKCYHAEPAGRDDGDRSLVSAPPSEEPIVGEKAMKGKSIDSYTHFAKTVAPSNSKYYKYIPVCYHDPAARPFAVYEFRYRGREGLGKEGVTFDIGHPAAGETTMAQLVAGLSEQEAKRRLLVYMERDRHIAETYPRTVSDFHEHAPSSSSRRYPPTSAGDHIHSSRRIKRERSATSDRHSVHNSGGRLNRERSQTSDGYRAHSSSGERLDREWSHTSDGYSVHNTGGRLNQEWSHISDIHGGGKRIKREPSAQAAFPVFTTSAPSSRFKARRLESGRFEYDLTEDEQDDMRYQFCDEESE